MKESLEPDLSTINIKINILIVLITNTQSIQDSVASNQCNIETLY